MKTNIYNAGQVGKPMRPKLIASFLYEIEAGRYVADACKRFPQDHFIVRQGHGSSQREWNYRPEQTNRGPDLGQNTVNF